MVEQDQMEMVQQVAQVTHLQYLPLKVKMEEMHLVLVTKLVEAEVEHWRVALMEQEIQVQAVVVELVVMVE